MIKLLENKYFKIILHYCYHLNSTFVLSYHQITQIMCDTFFHQWNSWPYCWLRHEYCNDIHVAKLDWEMLKIGSL